MVNNPLSDQWKVLDLPGLIEPGLFAETKDEQRQRMAEGVYMSLRDALSRQMGEVLCPALLSRDEMLKIKAGDQFFFTALYQQRPYLKEGQRYKRDWFKIVTQVPEGVTFSHLVRYWDKASTTNGDYTAGALEGIGSDGNFYFLDMTRGQWSTYDRDQTMLKTAHKDHERWGNVKIGHQQDPGSAGLDGARATNRLFQGFTAFFETVSGAKEVRSGPLESSMQGGQVRLLRGAWNDAFIEEFCAFDKGKYDDQVDASSSAHNYLLNKVAKARESRIL